MALGSGVKYAAIFKRERMTGSLPRLVVVMRWWRRSHNAAQESGANWGGNEGDSWHSTAPGAAGN